MVKINLDVVEAHLKAGASVDAKGWDSALIWAAQGGERSTPKTRPCTPRSMARASLSLDTVLDTVQALLKAGAKVDAKNSTSHTALAVIGGAFILNSHSGTRMWERVCVCARLYENTPTLLRMDTLTHALADRFTSKDAAMPTTSAVCQTPLHRMREQQQNRASSAH